jgi:RHS repeat-associated protein
MITMKSICYFTETPIIRDLGVEHIHGPLVQVQDYYAFGLAYNALRSDTGLKNNYQFNGGSEKEDALDLSLYGTFFRNYDPALGRFQSMDPMAGKYKSWSPYNFGFNDPVYWNDPMGDDAIEVNGNVVIIDFSQAGNLDT